MRKMEWPRVTLFFFSSWCQAGRSPIAFTICYFLDSIVLRVKSLNVGCYISLVCCRIYLYADDILLLSPSITGLQLLLNACEQELDDLDMRINVKKSTCIRFGRRYNDKCAELISSHGGSIQWVDRCRYLGVYFTSGRSFRCNFDDAKSRFFRAFNAIFSKVGRSASEPVLLSLIRAKCIPILLYGTEACPLLSRQKHSLEFTLTRIFMRLFRTGSPDVVKECQVNFSFLPITSQLCIRTARFLQQFTAKENSLCVLFARNALKQLNDIFAQNGDLSVQTACQLTNSVYEQFYNQF